MWIGENLEAWKCSEGNQGSYPRHRLRGGLVKFIYLLESLLGSYLGPARPLFTQFYGHFYFQYSSEYFGQFNLQLILLISAVPVSETCHLVQMATRDAG